MIVYIYEIICPITYKIKYVGQTINTQDRKSAHQCRKRNSTKDIDIWETSIVDKGYKPIFEVIDITDEYHCDEVETWWIQLYKKAGIELLNMRPKGVRGGAGRSKFKNTKIKLMEA